MHDGLSRELDGGTVTYRRVLRSTQSRRAENTDFPRHRLRIRSVLQGSARVQRPPTHHGYRIMGIGRCLRSGGVESVSNAAQPSQRTPLPPSHKLDPPAHAASRLIESLLCPVFPAYRFPTPGCAGTPGSDSANASPTHELLFKLRGASRSRRSRLELLGARTCDVEHFIPRSLCIPETLACPTKPLPPKLVGAPRASPIDARLTRDLTASPFWRRPLRSECRCSRIR